MYVVYQYLIGVGLGLLGGIINILLRMYNREFDWKPRHTASFLALACITGFLYKLSGMPDHWGMIAGGYAGPDALKRLLKRKTGVEE